MRGSRSAADWQGASFLCVAGGACYQVNKDLNDSLLQLQLHTSTSLSHFSLCSLCTFVVSEKSVTTKNTEVTKIAKHPALDIFELFAHPCGSHLISLPLFNFDFILQLLFTSQTIIAN